MTTNKVKRRPESYSTIKGVFLSVEHRMVRAKLDEALKEMEVNDALATLEMATEGFNKRLSAVIDSLKCEGENWKNLEYTDADEYDLEAELKPIIMDVEAAHCDAEFLVEWADDLIVATKQGD